MKKREALFNTKFNQFLRESFRTTCAYECKHTRGKDYLPFAEVKEHQINALLACKHGTFAYKISDAGLAFKPFDGFCLSGVPAFVVIQYASGVGYGLDIDDFLRERERSDRKSITEAEAESASTFSF